MISALPRAPRAPRSAFEARRRNRLLPSATIRVIRVLPRNPRYALERPPEKKSVTAEYNNPHPRASALSAYSAVSFSGIQNGRSLRDRFCQSPVNATTPGQPLGHPGAAPSNWLRLSTPGSAPTRRLRRFHSAESGTASGTTAHRAAPAASGRCGPGRATGRPRRRTPAAAADRFHPGLPAGCVTWFPRVWGARPARTRILLYSSTAAASWFCCASASALISSISAKRIT